MRSVRKSQGLEVSTSSLSRIWPWSYGTTTDRLQMRQVVPDLHVANLIAPRVRIGLPRDLEQPHRQNRVSGHVGPKVQGGGKHEAQGRLLDLLGQSVQLSMAHIQAQVLLKDALAPGRSVRNVYGLAVHQRRG